MPTTTLQPDSHLRLKFSVPKRGLIEFEVDAEYPVDTYVLDSEGLRQFEEGQEDIDSYGGFTNRKNHHQEIRLPFRGSWWLLIVNSDDKNPVAVHYEVFW